MNNTRVSKELVNLAGRKLLDGEVFSTLLVMGLDNLMRSNTVYAHEQLFKEIDELPIQYQMQVRILDAAADTEGYVQIPDVGTRKVRFSRMVDGVLKIGGTTYVIIDEKALLEYKHAYPTDNLYVNVADN